jgi:hypothetical protein
MANQEKRRVLREELPPEEEVLKDRKQIREEVTRRLVSGVKTASLEYDSLYNEHKASLNKDSDLLSLLFHRKFFYRLNEKLTGLGCDHTFRFTNQILTQMHFSRGKMNEVLEVFKRNSAHCDCEVIYYVESQLIGTNTLEVEHQ